MLPTVAQFLRSSLGVPDEDQPDFQGPRPYTSDPNESAQWDAAQQPTAGAGASWAPPAEPQYDPRQYDEGPRETGPAPWTPTSPEGTPASASVTRPAQPQYTYEIADGRTAPPTPGGDWRQMETRPRPVPAPVAQEPDQISRYVPSYAAQAANVKPQDENKPGFWATAQNTVREVVDTANRTADTLQSWGLEPAGGMPRMIARINEIQDIAAAATGKSRMSPAAVYDPQWSAANPELVAEYEDLQQQLGMGLMGTVGDAPKFGRAAARAAEGAGLTGAAQNAVESGRGLVDDAAQGAGRIWREGRETAARLNAEPGGGVTAMSAGGVPEGTIGRGGAPVEPWKRSGNELYREGIRESAVTRERAQRPVRPGTYYHVVPENYRPGDPLYAADELAARGYAEPSNKWAAENGGDASVWPDRDKVALAESYAEAYAFNQDYLNGRGRILEVTVPPDADAWGVRIARNDEGVPSADRMVPAEWIRPAPEHTGAPYRNMPEPTTAPSRTTVSPPLSPQERIDQMQAILNKMRPDDPMRSAYERAIADTQQQISRGELRGSPASRIWREGRETAARLNAEPGGGVTAAGLGAVPEGAMSPAAPNSIADTVESVRARRTPQQQQMLEQAQASAEEKLARQAEIKAAMRGRSTSEINRAIKDAGATLTKSEEAARIGFTGQEEVADVLREGQVIPSRVVAGMLGQFPSYLEGVTDFIVEQRQKLVSGTLTPRDVSKAYIHTVGSMQAGAQGRATLEAKLGRPVRDLMVDQGKVRPEEAIADWFFTPEGKRALDAIESGNVDQEAWNALLAMRDAYGNNTLRNMGVFGPKSRITGEIDFAAPIRRARDGTPLEYDIRNIGELTERLNAARGDTVAIMQEIAKVKGIGAAKPGFIKHLLGLGNEATFDAVEMNLWLTGKGDTGKLTGPAADMARAAKLYSDNPEVTRLLFDQIRARFDELRAAGVGAEIDPAVFNHVMHHWIWDAAKGLQTTHAGMYDAMRNAATLGAAPDWMRGSGGALNATNRVLSEGLAGGVGGAVIEQARNPDEDPRTAAARGFAAGAVGFPLATRAIRAGARRAGTGGAERVTAGALGNVPERAPEPRLTVEVLRERLDKVRALRDEARARGDVALERDANDVLGQLTTDLSDAMNARRALEPRIRSDIGRPIDELPLTESRGEQVASAAGAREAVRAPASELSAPIRVQPSTADRANAIMPFDPVSAGMGAGAGAELDEDGNPVGVDPLRAGAGAAVAGVMGHTPLGRSLSAKLAADAAKVAAAAKAGAKNGARLNAPIKAADGSKIPLSVRMAQALTDDLAATRWGENVLTDAAGRPRLAENSVARASTQTRINADGIANARIEDDLIPTVTAAEREGLADELSQHLEDMHTFDVLVNVYQRASDATRARLSSRARPPANINAMAEQAGEQAMRQWARESLNTTPETVVERLEGQRQRLAASGQDVRVTELAQTVWDHNRQTLQSLVDSGRMSAADAADIAAAYPHYVPSQPLADLMPDGAARAAGGSGPAVERFDTVGATNTRRGERLNPIIASRNATIERERIAKQNRAFTRFYDMVQGANASGSPLTQASAGPRPNRLAGEVEVSGWVNGKRETVRVPKPIADMLDSAARSGNPDAAMAFWGKVKQMVTETITSRRPAFFAVNLIRDFGDYALKASAELGGPKALPRVVGTYADELGKAFVDVASTLSRNQTLAGAAVSGTAGAAMGPEDQSASERATRGALYALAGGIGTGLAGRKIVPTGKAAEFVARGGGMDRLDAGWRGGQQWLREAQRSGGVVARNPAELARHAADILKDLALFEPMAQIGNRMELVPRTARMRLAERAGENATEAMIRGRDATVDFARGGELLKSWNRLIPFANVTVQGGAQLARTLRDHPAAALTTLAATLGPAMLATEVYNRQTPERAQAYSDIPNYIKDQGVVLMLPWAGSDARGDRPNYLWIPTGMATPFVQASRAAMQKTPGLESVEGPGIGETAMSILTMFSPVKGENLSSLAATVVPPIAKQGIELGTNRSTFTGNAIATDSADERASAFGQKVAGGVNRIGQMLGSDSLQEVRPSQVDYLTRQLPAYGDLIQGVSNDMAPTARRGEEQRPVQNMPVLGQSAGRIIRDTGGANLERAQQEALSDDTRAILQEAGVRPSEIQMAVPSKYKNATLTRDEQLDWQQAFNDVVDRRISQVTRSAEWRARGADQGKLLREAVSDARETAASRALRRLTEQEIQRRTREQAARKAS